MAQTILVTGSSSGFGRLIVETLAREGHSVFAGMRDVSGRNSQAAADLRSLADHAQFDIRVVDLDITDDASVTSAIETVIGSTGCIDVVVNNAGVVYLGSLEAFTPEQVRQQFDTNVFGMMRVNRAVLPQMRSQHSGLLLQIGSIAGRLSFPFFGLYSATKFAMEALTEAYRYELALFGIDAAIIEPGTYPTPINAKQQVAADSARFAPYKTTYDSFMGPFFQALNSDTPPDPQEVADAVANVIAMPAGKRPLHTVVATPSQRQSPEEINDATTHATRSYLEGIAVVPLVTFAP